MKFIALAFVVAVSCSFYFEYPFSLSAPPPYLFGMTVMCDAVAVVGGDVDAGKVAVDDVPSPTPSLLLGGCTTNLSIF